jgi:hypothetical protein
MSACHGEVVIHNRNHCQYLLEQFFPSFLRPTFRQFDTNLKFCDRYRSNCNIVFVSNNFVQIRI